MVVNTEICSYSEMKIWPGRGSRFVAKDSRTHIFLNSKVKCMFHQRIKPAKLTWTQTWRRLNKKVKQELVQKSKIKRKIRTEKAIVGANLDEIRKRRNEKPEVRAAMRDQAKREIKERQKKQQQSKQAPPPQRNQDKRAQPKAQKGKGAGRRRWVG